MALAVALYVTNAKVPLLSKGQSRTPEQDAAEIERNKTWDPNAALAGKPPVRPVAPAAPSAPASDTAIVPRTSGPVLPPPPESARPAAAAKNVETPKSTRDAAAILNGSDPAEAKVKISTDQIDSKVGVCKFLDATPDGKRVSTHVECQFPAGPLMGDITFTLKPNNTIDFVDRDKTYTATLYRCPK